MKNYVEKHRIKNRIQQETKNLTQSLLKSKIGKLWYLNINKTKNKSINIQLKAKFKRQIMGQSFQEYWETVCF